MQARELIRRALMTPPAPPILEGDGCPARDPKAEELQRMVAQAIPKAEKMARAVKASGACTRCGRAGHSSRDCNARSD